MLHDALFGAPRDGINPCNFPSYNYGLVLEQVNQDGRGLALRVDNKRSLLLERAEGGQVI